jgi:hypothetical protein
MTLAKEGTAAERLNRLSDEMGVIRNVEREISKQNMDIGDDHIRWDYTTGVLTYGDRPLLLVRAKQLTHLKVETGESLQSKSVKCWIDMDGTIEIEGARSLFKGRLGPEVDLAALMQKAFERPQVRYYVRNFSP